MQDKGSLPIKSIAVGVSLIIVLSFSLATDVVHRIAPHEVGLMVRSQDDIQLRPTGISVKFNPNTQLHRVSTATQDLRVTGLSVATSDNFDMFDTAISYTLRVPADRAVDLIRTSVNWEAIVNSAIADSTKVVLGRIELLDVPQNRGEIGAAIRDEANAALEEQFGIPGLITSAALESYQWREDAVSYLAEVRERQEAVRSAQFQAERDAIARGEALAEAENQEAIENAAARAAAQRKREEGKAEADSRRAIAQAETEALRARQQAELEHHQQLVDMYGAAIAASVLQWERWDGVMPRFSGSEIGLQLRHEIDVD